MPCHEPAIDTRQHIRFSHLPLGRRFWWTRASPSFLSRRSRGLSWLGARCTTSRNSMGTSAARGPSRSASHPDRGVFEFLGAFLAGGRSLRHPPRASSTPSSRGDPALLVVACCRRYLAAAAWRRSLQKSAAGIDHSLDRSAPFIGFAGGRHRIGRVHGGTLADQPRVGCHPRLGRRSTFLAVLSVQG